MTWREDFRKDVRTYTRRSGGSALKEILTTQGLWALLQYRIEASVYRGTLPAVIRRPLRIVLSAWHKLVEVATGIHLPCTAKIGAGLYLPHPGNVVIHGQAAMGEGCCLSQGVTVGISGRGDERGVPTLGNRVYVGVNAVVVGKITVGDDAVIGANSLVRADVPAHCTVLGVPAVVISDRGSEEYL